MIALIVLIGVLDVPDPGLGAGMGFDNPSAAAPFCDPTRDPYPATLLATPRELNPWPRAPGKRGYKGNLRVQVVD